MRLTVTLFGAHALLLQWGGKISVRTNLAVLSAQKAVTDAFPLAITDTVPAYSSLAIFVDRDIPIALFKVKLKKMMATVSNFQFKKETLCYTVPVCYESGHAPDIVEVAARNNLTVPEVVRLHSEKMYRVHFIGFLPGFPYLGGLHKRLHTPRKTTPRAQVPQGSVGIGNAQTGIYTQPSPGGWQLIGRSPLQFFNPKNEPPCLFAPGDAITFEPIPKADFIPLQNSVRNGNYSLKKTIVQ
ncbi:MAG: 5-oxoprolinase subunit PxpB [Marinirhabdus sp.]